MSRYDELFDDLAAHDSVFTDKSALDPLAEPEEIVLRTDQVRTLAMILTGVTEGHSSTTASASVDSSIGNGITAKGSKNHQHYK